MNLNLLKKYTRDLNILVVDDDRAILKLLTRRLSRYFREVISAENGFKALEIYRDSSDKIDIILTDISMPVLNGIGLTEEVRAISKTQPIIVISAHSESNFFLEFINLGVDGFILKPIENEKLLNQLYKIAKSVSESKAMEFYLNDMEGYINSILDKTMKLNNSNSILKKIMQTLDKSQRERVINSLGEEFDLAPISDFIKDDIKPQKRRVRESNLTKLKSNKLDAKSYLNKIEFDTYWRLCKRYLPYFRV